MKNAFCVLLFLAIFFSDACMHAFESQNISQEESVEPDVKRIEKEVSECFEKFIAALNARDSEKWQEFYSVDNFVSAVAGGTKFETREEWVRTIGSFFDSRKKQQVEVRNIKIVTIDPHTVITISSDESKFVLNDDSSLVADHIFTFIWKKEANGWKIVHSHESWVEKEN